MWTTFRLVIAASVISLLSFANDSHQTLSDDGLSSHGFSSENISSIASSPSLHERIRIAMNQDHNRNFPIILVIGKTVEDSVLPVPSTNSLLNIAESIESVLNVIQSMQIDSSKPNSDEHLLVIRLTDMEPNNLSLSKIFQTKLIAIQKLILKNNTTTKKPMLNECDCSRALQLEMLLMPELKGLLDIDVGKEAPKTIILVDMARITDCATGSMNCAPGAVSTLHQHSADNQRLNQRRQLQATEGTSTASSRGQIDSRASGEVSFIAAERRLIFTGYICSTAISISCAGWRL